MTNRNNIDWHTYSRDTFPHISPAKFKAECERLASLFAAADTDEDEMILALYEHDWMDVDWFEAGYEAEQATLETFLSAILTLS